MTKHAPIPAADREVTPSHNEPPDAFGAHATNVEDLYVEAKNWADGEPVETEEQAAEVDRLIDMIKDAIAACEATRDAEIEPLSAQVTAIREKYYPLVGETKKVTGRAILAKKALLQVKTVWANKVRAGQQAEADRLRKEAMVAAKAAAEAGKSAEGDLGTAETVEDLVREAQTLLRGASIAERSTPKGLRTIWRVEVADANVAMRTMWARHRDELTAFAKTLAERDVREGKRVLEGFTITEDKVAV